MQSTSNISNINQHILCFCSDEIYRLLEEESAIVYVCGDAKGMARDVTQAFVSIIAEKKGVYKASLLKFIFSWRKPFEILEKVP